MADENIVRSYRSIGPARRSTEPVSTRDVAERDAGARDEAPRNDPLAELARLIGQSDPFADMPTSARNRAPASAAQPRPDSAPASDWRATAAALAREAMRNPPVDDPRYEDADPQERIDSAIADIDSYRTSDSYYAETYAEPEHAPPEAEQDTGHHYDPGHHYDARQHYDDRDYDQEQHFGISSESAYAEDPSAQPQRDDEPNYFLDGEAPPADERFYDDPPRARHGNGWVTAAVLVGCALLGTAGAYGYRSYYGGARSTDAPIISADPTPNKMVPATASVDPGQQQTGDKGADERIVTHQEEPVTLAAQNPNPAPAATPRVVLPAPYPVAPSAKPPAPPTSTAAIPSNPPAPASGTPEAKKVRTVTIRPDGSDAGTQPLITTTPPTQATLPAPPAPARPTPKAAQPRSNGGPLSLEPRAQGSEPAPRAPAERAPKLASVSSGAASGGWSVQLSSQRSEAEAQASFRSLQAKYPRELGDRNAFVQRADLGEKGIYYRTMVGPFASKADADQLCGSLKAAGGQCNLHKN